MSESAAGRPAKRVGANDAQERRKAELSGLLG